MQAIGINHKKNDFSEKINDVSEKNKWIFKVKDNKKNDKTLLLMYSFSSPFYQNI